MAIFFALFLLPHNCLGRFLVKALMPYPTSFSKATFEAPLRLSLKDLVIQYPGARIEARQTRNHFSLRLFPPSLVIRSELDGIHIKPKAGWIQPVVFTRGKLHLKKGGEGTLIRLESWVSPSLHMEGEAFLNRDGGLQNLEIRGRSDPALFKSYISDEFETYAHAAAWSPFRLRYLNSSLEIELDHKTILRSRWTAQQ